MGVGRGIVWGRGGCSRRRPDCAMRPRGVLPMQVCASCCVMLTRQPRPLGCIFQNVSLSSDWHEHKCLPFFFYHNNVSLCQTIAFERSYWDNHMISLIFECQQNLKFVEKWGEKISLCWCNSFEIHVYCFIICTSQELSEDPLYVRVSKLLYQIHLAVGLIFHGHLEVPHLKQAFHCWDRHHGRGRIILFIYCWMPFIHILEVSWPPEWCSSVLFNFSYYAFSWIWYQENFAS